MYSPIHRLWSCSHILATTNKTTLDLRVQLSLGSSGFTSLEYMRGLQRVSEKLELKHEGSFSHIYIPRRGIISHTTALFNLLRTLHGVFQNGCINLHSNSIQVFTFLHIHLFLFQKQPFPQV